MNHVRIHPNAEGKLMRCHAEQGSGRWSWKSLARIKMRHESCAVVDDDELVVRQQASPHSGKT